MANPLMYGWGIDVSHAPGFKRAAALQNYKAGIRTLVRYANLAGSTIHFEGLTPTMSERAMRMGFLWYPLVCIFRVGDDWINLPAVPGGRGFNAQGNFGDAYAYGKNGKVYHIKCHIPGEDEAAFLSRTPGGDMGYYDYDGYCLRANDSCFPLIETIIFDSQQIADLLSAIANVTPLFHHPIEFSCTQKQRASALKWWKELDANIPFIFAPSDNSAGGTKIDAQPVNLLANGDLIKPTMELVDWWDNRCLTEIGIKNAGSQVDKKGENLTTDEVNSTDTVTSVVVQNQVDLINRQIKEMGIDKEPGLEGFRAVVGGAQSEDVRADDSGEGGGLPGVGDGATSEDDL